jgi:hypothetical protein
MPTTLRDPPESFNTPRRTNRTTLLWYPYRWLIQPDTHAERHQRDPCLGLVAADRPLGELM